MIALAQPIDLNLEAAILIAREQDLSGGLSDEQVCAILSQQHGRKVVGKHGLYLFADEGRAVPA